MATDPWGIDDGYHDVAGTWHATSDDTRSALRAAMGGDGDRLDVLGDHVVAAPDDRPADEGPDDGRAATCR